MFAAIAQFLDRWSHPLGAGRVEVVADSDGVSILLRDGSKVPQFRWAEVAEIRTFKADLGTVDDIRLAFLAGGSWHEFSEDTRGFPRLADSMAAAFPTIPASWHPDMMFPAFATNERILYRRTS